MTPSRHLKGPFVTGRRPHRGSVVGTYLQFVLIAQNLVVLPQKAFGTLVVNHNTDHFRVKDRTCGEDQVR